MKYDCGDYVSYQPEQGTLFDAIPDKPIPAGARYLIHLLGEQLGRVPPDTGIPRPREDFPPTEEKR